MFPPVLSKVLPFVLLFLVTDLCDDVSGPEKETSLDFTSSSINTKSAPAVTSSKPEKSFSATVEISSGDAIEPADVQVVIQAICRSGGGDEFNIPLQQNGLLKLKGSKKVNASFCNDPTTGQRDQVTYTVYVTRVNTDINFSAVVTTQGG